MKPVIIVAPQGAGKSRRGAALLKALGCARLVDGWDGAEPLQDGDLALTHAPIVWKGEFTLMDLVAAKRIACV